MDVGFRGAEEAAVPPKIGHYKNHQLITWICDGDSQQRERDVDEWDRRNVRMWTVSTWYGLKTFFQVYELHCKLESVNSDKQADPHFIHMPLYETSASQLRCIILNYETVYTWH